MNPTFSEITNNIALMYLLVLIVFLLGYIAFVKDRQSKNKG